MDAFEAWLIADGTSHRAVGVENVSICWTRCVRIACTVGLRFSRIVRDKTIELYNPVIFRM
jgi:hypothetical protein